MGTKDSIQRRGTYLPCYHCTQHLKLTIGICNELLFQYRGIDCKFVSIVYIFLDHPGKYLYHLLLGLPMRLYRVQRNKFSCWECERNCGPITTGQSTMSVHKPNFNLFSQFLSRTTFQQWTAEERLDGRRTRTLIKNTYYMRFFRCLFRAVTNRRRKLVHLRSSLGVI